MTFGVVGMFAYSVSLGAITFQPAEISKV